MGVEQSNTSIVFGDSFVLKIFRRLDPGINPDLEIGSFLTEKDFEYSPRVKGFLQYEKDNETCCAGILHQFVPNQGDAWSYTLDILGGYLERILTLDPREQKNIPSSINILEAEEGDIPPIVSDLIHPYKESARLLGQRAAELHLVLSSDPENPNFAPETLSALAQRSLYQSMRNLTMGVFQIMATRVRTLSEAVHADARNFLDRRTDIMKCFSDLKERRIATKIIRCHGDYHLGQVLHTGKDFVIIDFEGEPSRTLGERRAKRCPLTDVASMIRSFSYAAHSALLNHSTLRREDLPILEPWIEAWHKYVSALFLQSYLKTAENAPFLPKNKEDLKILLEAFLLEKAIYELGYELNNRPDWVGIPLKGIKDILCD
jgi:maltose alpha-D-glucosyltransferase/alpha-amylase